MQLHERILHDEKTRDLPGLLVEPAKATITKIRVIREPAQHTNSRDPEEEDKAGQNKKNGSKGSQSHPNKGHHDQNASDLVANTNTGYQR